MAFIGRVTTYVLVCIVFYVIFGRLFSWPEQNLSFWFGGAYFWVCGLVYDLTMKKDA